MSIAPIDRIEKLGASTDVVGIDFVYVLENQQDLFIFFYDTSKILTDAACPVTASQITIEKRSDPLFHVALDPSFHPTWNKLVLPVLPMDTGTRPVLHIKTTAPGDFSEYTLKIDDSSTLVVDPYFNEVIFSFKANCPSDLDCKTPGHECPPDEVVDYPINYQARDFWSIRQALLDFASDRHPEWKDRLEADLGMMLVEVMSATGDEFAYYQDRIARESYLETAAERRSLRRHARLVDYEIHNGKGGTAWLDFQVASTAPIPLPIYAGTKVVAADSQAIYEVGNGLSDGFLSPAPPPDLLSPQNGSATPISFNVFIGANELQVYQWDSNDTCLEAGSTSLHVVRDANSGRKTDFDFIDAKHSNKWVLLQTSPADASVPARSHLVHLVDVEEVSDPLIPLTLTKLTWDQAQATPFEMEFASLTVHGNILHATAGETMEAYFQIGGDGIDSLEPGWTPPYAIANAYYNENFSSDTIERQEPLVLASVLSDEDVDYDPSFLFSLPGSEDRDLVWHGPDVQSAAPEVRLIDYTGGAEWDWKRSFIGQISSQSESTDFTIDEGTWRRVTSYRRVDETGAVQEFDHYDFANGRGSTVRFGNGEFGSAPTRGRTFRAVYRLGNGRGDNLAAGVEFTAIANIAKITNCFGVVDSVEPETPEHVRLSAPYAFHSERFNAVIEDDYKTAVEKLTWVERASAGFRWTGSWATLFATPDPKGSYAITSDEEDNLQQQLDRYRLAGREAYGMNPKYADLTLDICLCLDPRAYRGDVEAAVLEALFGHAGIRPKPGFFSPDNWSFGQSLKRASLEAAIQSAFGVRAVESICIARRGWFTKRAFVEQAYSVGLDEIVRVSNDRNHPEQGLITLNVEGGI